MFLSLPGNDGAFYHIPFKSTTGWVVGTVSYLWHRKPFMTESQLDNVDRLWYYILDVVSIRRA
jgi:hypothetical protein